MANSWRISALAERHRALGSKLEDWSGMGTAWTYASDLADEHEAIRTRAGLMDVSGPMSVNDESELPWLIEENGLQAELCTVSALQETAILIEDVIAGVAGQALDRTVTQ